MTEHTRAKLQRITERKPSFELGWLMLGCFVGPLGLSLIDAVDMYRVCVFPASIALRLLAATSLLFFALMLLAYREEHREIQTARRLLEGLQLAAFRRRDESSETRPRVHFTVTFTDGRSGRLTVDKNAAAALEALFVQIQVAPSEATVAR
jgi:hypothetical protein